MGQTKETAGRSDVSGAGAGEAAHAPHDGGAEAARGASEPGEPTNRDTIPTGIDLKHTLPTGAAFHATWKMPAWRQSVPQIEHGESGVRRLDLPEPVSREALGNTLRMEIGLSVPVTPPGVEPEAAYSPHGPHNDPRDTLEPSVPISATHKAAFSSAGDSVRAAAVQRVGQAEAAADGGSERPISMRPTDPFGHPAEKRAARERQREEHEPEGVAEVVGSAPPDAAHVPSDGAGPKAATNANAKANSARPQAASTSERPWGDVRPHYDHEEYQRQYASEPQSFSELVRDKKVILAAAAAGLVTLLCLLALGDSDDIVVEEQPEASAQTYGTPTASADEPYVVKPAPLPGTAAAATAPAAAPSTQVEIVTVPAHAELVFNGAILSNTPSKVARASGDTDYLLRLTGYEPQLVRIGADSPASITVQLKAALPEAPAPEAEHAAPPKPAAPTDAR